MGREVLRASRLMSFCAIASGEADEHVGIERLKTFDAAHPGPKTESLPGSGVATPSRVFGIGGKGAHLSLSLPSLLPPLRVK